MTSVDPEFDWFLKALAVLAIIVTVIVVAGVCAAR